jgi:serine protease Do
MSRFLICLLFFCSSPVCGGQPDQAPSMPPLKTVEQLAESVRQSVVVITTPGRDGKRQGLGSGFVIAADGLVATNLHVIGEGRPIAVQTADGRRHEVSGIHATDRAADLAIIRIDTKNLVPLPLGNSDVLKQGQAVVAVGNPRGLTHSVVSGIVSGTRDIDERKMIQIAIPIEQGNSGGPLLDMHGQVQGILTMKSLVTANLGFAMPVSALKPLLAKPNPIAMARWLALGALDAEQWTMIGGARWRQRAGRIQVDGAGGGFGGRSLCLSKKAVSELPFELSVTVRLEDESGAAGLAFHADGGDRHYGFYPTSGKLRLTRFDGPDVFSWKVLHDQPSVHYRPGEWNTLRVQLDKNRIRCYVNDHLVIESTDDGLTSGQVGLAKFRDTRAEFRDFQVGRELTTRKPSGELDKRIRSSLAKLDPQQPAPRDLVQTLAPDAPASVAMLREQARLLERQSTKLRELAQAVHQEGVYAELTKVTAGKEDEIDLLHAALLVAKLDHDDVSIDAYRREVERMAREVNALCAKDADEKTKLTALNQYLFTERGFHGSRSEYYSRENSYLPSVIDDREGLPITLSVLYMELARRIGLKVVGVGLPGHFVVRHEPAQGESQLIDVFNSGVPLSRAEAEQKVKAITGDAFKEEHLATASKRQIIVRMLHNLLGLSRADRDVKGALRYLDAIVAVTPDAAEERWMRAVVRAQLGERPQALEDVDWLLERRPDGIEIDRVIELRRLLMRPER